MVRVLIADDSGFMRRVIRSILLKKVGISVCGEAQDGFEMLELARSLRPDVILMDIQMPKMDGLSALSRLIAQNPIPVVVLSAFTSKDSYLAIECLQNGAVGVIEKPGGTVAGNIDSLSEEIVQKVMAASKAKVAIRSTAVEPVAILKQSISSLPAARALIVVVAGTGGPAALELFCAMLPKGIKAGIMIAQHIQGSFVKSLVDRLDSTSAVIVREACQGEEICEGVVYLCGSHVAVSPQKTIEVLPGPPINGSIPNGDVLIESAVAAFKNGIIGIVLTGDGTDGKRGMALVKMNGGKVICQDEETSVIFSMPSQVIASGNCDFVLPLDKIAQKAAQIAGE